MHTWELKKRGRRGEKAVIYTPPSPLCFDFSFSSAKIMCILIRTRKGGRRPLYIFIHISSGGTYVHTWGMKGRSRNGEKECIYTPERYLPFGFPFPLKKEHVHTYPHTKWGRRPRNVCIHGGWKKRGRRGEKADVLHAH